MPQRHLADQLALCGRFEVGIGGVDERVRFAEIAIMQISAGSADQFSPYFALPEQAGRARGVAAASSAAEFRRTGVNPNCTRNGTISATMKGCGRASKISLFAFTSCTLVVQCAEILTVVSGLSHCFWYGMYSRFMASTRRLTVRMPSAQRLILCLG
jgi:hypothetical protein